MTHVAKYVGAVAACVVGLAVAADSADAQLAPPVECEGNVGYTCARAVILKHTGEPCLVNLDPRWPRCVEPASAPDVAFPQSPALPSAPPMPAACWYKTNYACARSYILDLVGGECLVSLDRAPRCVEPATLGEPPLPALAYLCLSPVTCTSPFDDLGVPRVPPPSTSPGGATTLVSRPPSLQCDPRDYITTLRSLAVARTDPPPLVNETPVAAIIRYLPRPSLPPGLSAADWALHETSASPDRVYYVTRDATKTRILGVIGVARANGSWEVYHLAACGEYLYPGSLVVDSAIGGVAR